MLSVRLTLTPGYRSCDCVNTNLTHASQCGDVWTCELYNFMVNKRDHCILFMSIGWESTVQPNKHDVSQTFNKYCPCHTLFLKWHASFTDPINMSWKNAVFQVSAGIYCPFLKCMYCTQSLINNTWTVCTLRDIAESVQCVCSFEYIYN